MRRRDPLIALEDVVTAGETIAQFLQGRSLEDYQGDGLLRSAVERQFEIVGEAMNRALNADPSLREKIPGARRAVDMRNVLAHAYDEIIDETVYRAATEQLPGLVVRSRDVLSESA
jgi:uncharacterized protein with HEPN domain